MAKFILVTPARLGDTIFITPAIRLLKTIFPEAEIDLIALSTLAAEVFQGNPYVHCLFLNPTVEELKSRQDDYDYKINIHHSEKAKEYLSIFNAKELVYRLKDSGEKKHRAEQLLLFIAEAFGYSLNHFKPHYDLFPNADHRLAIESLLSKNQANASEPLLVGFHLGCHGLAKKHSRFWRRFSHEKAWPVKNFIQLAEKLQRNNAHISFVLTGSKEELFLGEEFCKKVSNTINFIDKISILELTSLMCYLKLFVTNDTGALHVACATEVNLIALFGPSDSTLHGPFPEREQLVKLQKNPIKKIKVDEVYSSLRKLLELSSENKSDIMTS